MPVTLASEGVHSCEVAISYRAPVVARKVALSSPVRLKETVAKD
jgi:hypothetical protein